MGFSPDFADFVVEQMAGWRPVTIKKIFGEGGLYSGPVLFAVIADDILYFKARGALADELKALGSQPFSYAGRSGKRVDMPCWRAPENCLENSDDMMAWCKKVYSATLNDSAQKKPPAKGEPKASGRVRASSRR